MKILVTGGAGFIGRWVVLQLLQAGHQVWTIDDLSNGSEGNLAFSNAELAPLKPAEAMGRLTYRRGDIRDRALLAAWFAEHRFPLCYHLAAEINVQKSIDHPQDTFSRDVEGTFGLLELCRVYGTRFVFMSTCMVYSPAPETGGIDEGHPVLPASPYAGAKLSGEHLAISYYHAYGLPVTVIRPFNTYGPCQKTNGEGGVVAIFVERALRGEPLHIFGDGTQTRDLLYVEDCARFVIQAGIDEAAVGQLLNAGSGREIAVRDLASLIGEVTGAGEGFSVDCVAHPHPQSEIRRLLCDYTKAETLLGWRPRLSLEEGIARTAAWLKAVKPELRGGER
ncbi:NAD-dependent epimerase/dehydratase family protein [Heliobacterium gestii]|uniref:NAD-dependent epimerase/dehydratase family protein n=1 Tax=Heliomicrobium gestii TaxID=2699 RepID=A0A845L8C9_HELGE|nr:GDP-mannose 4,6-dehydratase [Heliomicrobium gestii]MBM7866723.1 nucleoside-diphosphate-sugar epimerase [Heliomicrobium gestii]MZP42997.1 NAD-dependent epimerase/dehydratase family protein [Heliomicrobium gestii]